MRIFFSLWVLVDVSCFPVTSTVYPADVQYLHRCQEEGLSGVFDRKILWLSLLLSKPLFCFWIICFVFFFPFFPIYSGWLMNSPCYGDKHTPYLLLYRIHTCPQKSDSAKIVLPLCNKIFLIDIVIIIIVFILLPNFR